MRLRGRKLRELISQVSKKIENFVVWHKESQHFILGWAKGNITF